MTEEFPLIIDALINQKGRLEFMMNYRATIVAAPQAAALYIAGLIIPVLGQLFALLTPVPLIITYIQNGRSHGLFALTLSVVVVGTPGRVAAGCHPSLQFRSYGSGHC